MKTENEIELRASFEKILPMGMPSLLEKCVKLAQEYALQNNEVKITSKCKDPNCEYCHGTGEIKVDNPTAMIISYCECFGNGTMSSVRRV